MTSLVYMFSFLSGNALPSVNKVEISKLSKKVWIFLQINCNVLFLPLIPKKILLEKFKESFLLFHFRKIFFSCAEKCYGATSFCHRHQKNQENSKKIYPRSGNSQNFCSRTNPKLAENSDGSGTRKFWILKCVSWYFSANERNEPRSSEFIDEKYATKNNVKNVVFIEDLNSLDEDQQLGGLGSVMAWVKVWKICDEKQRQKCCFYWRSKFFGSRPGIWWPWKCRGMSKSMEILRFNTTSKMLFLFKI